MSSPVSHLRSTALLLLTLGLITACAIDSPPTIETEPEESVTQSTENAGEHTVVLMQGRRGEIASENLSLDLISIKDGRCPLEVQCIWAGHAAVTLHVSSTGLPAQTVMIGTPAPASMQFPGEATYEGYRIRLIRLEPGNTQDGPALSAYRATVGVLKR